MMNRCRNVATPLPLPAPASIFQRPFSYTCPPGTVLSEVLWNMQDWPAQPGTARSQPVGVIANIVFKCSNAAFPTPATPMREYADPSLPDPYLFDPMLTFVRGSAFSVMRLCFSPTCLPGPTHSLAGSVHPSGIQQHGPCFNQLPGGLLRHIGLRLVSHAAWLLCGGRAKHVHAIDASCGLVDAPIVHTCAPCAELHARVGTTCRRPTWAAWRSCARSASRAAVPPPSRAVRECILWLGLIIYNI